MFKITNHPRGLSLFEFYNQNNMHVVLSNYGASIYSIGTVDSRGDLECVTLTPLMINYYNNTKYYGLTVGRVAGRIKDSSFTIDNETFKCIPNEKDNLLHSGNKTLAHRFFNYNIADSDTNTKVTYSISIKDMEDDFPGDLELKVIYTLFKLEDTILVEFQGISSKDTLLNITNHTYFNLSGNYKSSIEKHYLKMNKPKMGVFDEGGILSDIVPVKKEFDFRKGMMISDYLRDDAVLLEMGGYDHYFTGDEKLNLELYDPMSRRHLKIESNYKDVVIYTNNQSTDYILSNNTADSPYLGIAIEPNRFTNILKDGGIIQKANSLYNYYIKYSFSVKDDRYEK